MAPEQMACARGTLKMTQQNVADFLGVSPRQIIRYENGTTPIPKTVEIILTILTTRKIPKW
tara:strand:+ start:112 stop:294 length:183 start_codon:yes stop_codon:yes gene_type:complete